MTRRRNVSALLLTGGLVAAAALLASSALLTAPANAQSEPYDSDSSAGMQAMMDAMTPSKGHKRLNAMVGHWDADVTIWMTADSPPMRFPGTVDRKWVLGGRYIKEIVKATSDEGPFEGIGYIGFNNIDGRYESTWMETMSTAIMFATGTYDDTTHTLTTTAQSRDAMTGKVYKAEFTLDMSKKNVHRSVGYTTGADGHKFKSFEAVFTRK